MYRNSLWNGKLFSVSLTAEYIFQIDISNRDDL